MTEEYDYQWLFEILVQVRMAKKVIPVFRIGDDDPEKIKELKNKLCRSEADLEYLECFLDDLMTKTERIEG